MDAKQFLAEFRHIADAPEGINNLRKLIFHLAVKGDLTERLPADSEVDPLIKEILTGRKKYIDLNKIRVGKRKNAEIKQEALDLPKEWSSLQAGDLMHLINGRAFKSSEWDASGVPIIRIQNLNNSKAKFNYYSGELDEKNTIRTGDMLLSWSGTPGTSFGAFIWDGPEGALNQHIFKVEIYSEHIDKIFLKMVINALLDALILSARGGVGLKHVTKGQIEALNIPIPPLEEQQRIVTKVDELMALCDKLEAQQQKRHKLQTLTRTTALDALVSAQSPHELKDAWVRVKCNFTDIAFSSEDVAYLKQTIRVLALQGLLTSDNNKLSDSLKNIISNAKDSVSESEIQWALPPNWEWCRFGWMGESRLGKMLDKSKNTGVAMPYLRNKNVRWRKFDLSDLLDIKVEERELDSISAFKGDLLICEGGEPGRAAIWDKDESIVIQKALHRFRSGEDLVPEYALLCLEADYFSGYVSKYYTGAGIKHLTGKSLYRYVIPVPPIETQMNIVGKVSELMTFCDAIEKNISSANRVQSKFAEAIVGNLTGRQLKDEEKMKVPETELVSTLKLKVSPTNNDQAPLSAILAKHNGELSSKALWNYSGLEIDTFYRQLKTEMARDWIIEPHKARVIEKDAEEPNEAEAG